MLFVKRILLAIMIVLVMTECVLAADFRNVGWGMTEEEVIKVEELSLEKIDSGEKDITQLVGKTKIDDFDCNLYYWFVKGKLAEACYSFWRKAQDPNMFVSDFQKIDKLLIAKYGSPAFHDEFFRFEDKGLSIFSGNGRMITKWNIANKGFVLHTLRGIDNDILHLIIYSNYHWQDILEKVRAEDINSSL